MWRGAYVSCSQGCPESRLGLVSDEIQQKSQCWPCWAREGLPIWSALVQFKPEHSFGFGLEHLCFCKISTHHVRSRLSRAVKSQSRKATLQPGFLAYQGANMFQHGFPMKEDKKKCCLDAALEHWVLDTPAAEYHRKQPPLMELFVSQSR